MSLPHLKSNYFVKKHVYEQNLVRKRNFEENYRKEWNDKVKYFCENNVNSNKYKAWSSDKSFNTSIEAFKRQDSAFSKDMNSLKIRRKRLEELLSNERKIYQIEMEQELAMRDQSVDMLKFRTEALKSAREEERKKEARRLYYEHFRLNNPDLRKIESEITNRDIIQAWPDQIQEKKQSQHLIEEENQRFQENLSHQIKLDENEAQINFQNKILVERQMKDSLRRQIDEIKRKEQESKFLKEQEEKLILAKEEMEIIDSQRKKKNELQKRQDYGRALLRQHAAIMRRKSQQIQQEMEEDLRFLNLLAEKDEEENEIQSARKEQAQLDADWMRNEMENQLRNEREREMELDSMFAEEAAKLWSKRELEWQKEREARSKLMEEVLHDRKLQIEEKIQEARRKQVEALREREQILSEIENDKFEQFDRYKSSKEKQDEYRFNLENQMTDRRNKVDKERYDRKKQLESELNEEFAYEELLKREAERMRLEGVTPRSARR